jgi:putative membrane protein
LLNLSDKTGEKIPRAINVAKNASIQQLTKVKGQGFVGRFLRHEIQDHKKTIAAFKREAEHGQNAEIKGYAQKTLPTLEEHLRKAEELARSERHS